MKEYRNYLFDADGTLFDTTELICDCFQYVAVKYTGRKIDREKILGGIGSPLRYQLSLHLQIPEEELQPVLDDYLEYQLKAAATGLQLFPRVQHTLEQLKERGKALAVVTSRRRISLTVFLERTGILQYFDVLVSPEDTTKHKPEPDPVQKALELLEASAGDTVFVGDTHYDISSGSGAGVDTVFVSWSHARASSLPVQPTWIIDSMSELLGPG